MKARLARLFLTACLLPVCAPGAEAGTSAAGARSGSAGAQTRGRAGGGSPRRARQRRLRRPDVIYVPTPPETVDEMLRQARLGKGDVLFDLGSGDGRIPLAAAKKYGVRAVGVEIDEKLVAAATEEARREGLGGLVSFRNEDMFGTDLSEATVVTLYLSNRLNEMLRPKLLRELRPGARIVSHDFRMGDWPPEQAVRVPWKNLYRTVYVWTVPRGGRYKKGRVSGLKDVPFGVNATST